MVRVILVNRSMPCRTQRENSFSALPALRSRSVHGMLPVHTQRQITEIGRSFGVETIGWRPAGVYGAQRFIKEYQLLQMDPRDPLPHAHRDRGESSV